MSDRPADRNWHRGHRTPRSGSAILVATIALLLLFVVGLVAFVLASRAPGLTLVGALVLLLWGGVA